MMSLKLGLVDFWPLHEASGAGYGCATGVTMSDEGGVTQAAGKVLLARDFSGSSQRLVHASDAIVQTGDSSYTWCAWVLWDSTATSVFLCKDNVSGTGREYNLQNNTTTPRFVVFRSGPTAVTLSSSASITTATWYFVAAWHDAIGDTMGIQVNTTRDTQATGGALQAAGAGDLHFGSQSDNTLHLNGRMCEVGFWKRLLTISELMWLYNNGLGRSWPLDGRPSPLVLYNDHRRQHRLVGMAA